ncbi:MAG: phosphoribosylglycinamide formyltransferase [Bacteroidales bacterium]|nr:phosphoribosylglycinamide formyltransferase [Bacteroidales bacterium]
MKQALISIWASGNGSNAENIVRFFQNHPYIKVDNILTNKIDAGVIIKAKNLGIPCFYFPSKDFTNGEKILTFLQKNKVSHIVLAGFLIRVPESIIQKFRNKIINIHPALLPKYGGKGMYGRYVHEAVIKDKQTKSGITIHLVDEEYDHGKIVFQYEIDLDENESPESLEHKIHSLEYQFYPVVIEKWIMGKLFI